MIHSERDLARKVAKALASAGEPEFLEANTQVEEVLSKGRKESPGHFDLLSSIAVGNLIVAVSKLAFDVWKHYADAKSSEQVDPKVTTDTLRTRIEEVKGLQEVDERLKETIILRTLEVLRKESS
jgi:hypothetical protein